MTRSWVNADLALGPALHLGGSIHEPMMPQPWRRVAAGEIVA